MVVRMNGMFVSLHSMLMSRLVVALGMVLRCCMVGDCCVFVLFRCLFMCIVFQRSPR